MPSLQTVCEIEDVSIWHIEDMLYGMFPAFISASDLQFHHHQVSSPFHFIKQNILFLPFILMNQALKGLWKSLTPLYITHLR
jgi:hypothetical protein